MWARIKTFFKHSETIAWARFQGLVGVVAGGLTFIDPTLLQPVLTTKGFTFYLLANAVATEYLRRRRFKAPE